MPSEEHPDLLDALRHIDPTTLDYGEWFAVGAALQREGYEFEDWDKWLAASGSPKYEGPAPLMTHWRSFHEDGAITGASIARMARDRGWSPSTTRAPLAPRKGAMRTVRLEDSVLNTVDRGAVYAPPNPALREQVDDAHAFDADMLVRYLEALFGSDEVVAWSSASRDGKPADSGKWKRRDAWIDDIRARGAKALYGDFRDGGASDAGAWIRFNPMNGEDIKDANVTDYRNALVEADSGEPEQQQAIMEAMGLPIVALTYSGGKSMHAIVAIDATNREQYRDRVNLLYAECAKAGLDVDTQNKNPARLSRMPGVARGGVMQRLIYTWRDKRQSRPTWDEWRDLLAEQADTMPKTQALRDLIARTDCEQAPELVAGVLRVGHKMMLSAPSKAGKSFLLMELCATIADAPPSTRWLAWDVPQRGRVLYINLELDAPDCRQRFIDIYGAMGIDVATMSDNLQVLNLRGHGAPLDELAPFVVKRCEELAPLVAVVIDPMYKVSTGDENSAADMGRFCNALDVIASCGRGDGRQYGPSVIYAHHFVKTGYAQREAMSRASGSGVFVRDGDALLVMTPIDSSDDAYLDACSHGRDGRALENPRVGFTMEGSLRSFPDFRPFKVWFEHPIHYVDESNEISRAMHKQGGAVKLDWASRTPRERAAAWSHITDDAIKASEVEKVCNALAESGCTDIRGEAMELLGIGRETLQKFVGQTRSWRWVRGQVVLNEEAAQADAG